MFEQAVLPIQDREHFDEVKAALEQTFAPGNIAGFLARLKRAKLRVRDFEGMLSRELLGRQIVQAYDVLGNSDRGQARELYLSLVERVPYELRGKYLKLFAYY